MSDFQRACINGDILKVEEIIKSGIKLHKGEIKHGLRYAYQYGNLQIVERMIELEGLSHFYNACKNGDILKVEEIINSGINLSENEINHGIKYGLRSACMGGHLQIVEKIIELGCLSKDDLDGGLADACSNGNLQLMERMIELGANYFSWGLICACSSGYLQIVERMVELGNGGLNQRDFNEGLCHACLGGHLQIAERMIELGADNFNWGLSRACCSNSLKIIERMIELGATQFNWGLADACRCGHLKIVERMIELGADDFNKGIEIACLGGHLNIAEKMIKLGGKFKTKDCEVKYKKLLEIKKILSDFLIPDLVYEIMSY